MPAFEHTLNALQVTSGCLLHPVFHRLHSRAEHKHEMDEEPFHPWHKSNYYNILFVFTCIPFQIFREHIGFQLDKERTTERIYEMDRRRKQQSKFMLFQLWYNLQYMLLNLGRDMSSDSKGLTPSSSLVQSLSRKCQQRGKGQRTKDRLRGEAGQKCATFIQ